jgi:hypothetical protein
LIDIFVKQFSKFQSSFCIFKSKCSFSSYWLNHLLFECFWDLEWVCCRSSFHKKLPPKRCTYFRIWLIFSIKCYFFKEIAFKGGTLLTSTFPPTHKKRRFIPEMRKQVRNIQISFFASFWIRLSSVHCTFHTSWNKNWLIFQFSSEQWFVIFASWNHFKRI